MEIQNVATMFEELFLTEEEEKMYQLQKLEKIFILSEEDIYHDVDKLKDLRKRLDKYDGYYIYPPEK